MPDTLVEIALGLAIGLPAGWILRGMRYARRAAHDAHEARRKVDEMIARDDDGRVTFQTIALAVVVALAFVATVVSGYAARQSADATDRTRSIASCSQHILEQTVLALNQRTAFSDEQADARRDVLATQAALVDAMLDRDASDALKTRLARAYQDAVKTQLRLDDRNDQRRAQYPYPTPSQIRGCD